MSRLPSILFPGQEADAVIDDYYLPLNVANKEPDNGFDLEDNRNVKKERVEEDQLTWGQIVGNAGMKQGYYDAFLNYLTLWKYPEGYGEKSRKALRHVARLYCVKDGKLFKKATKEDERDRQVVPTKQVVQILRECHDHVLSVHQGIKATYQRVKQRYYWPGYYDTVREYVQSCKVCQGFDIANVKIPLHTVEDRVDGAFAKIGIDYIYTPKTSQGHSGALVIIDYLTAWVHVEPVSTQSASSTCLGLFKWICQYGCLSQIIADNGSVVCKAYAHQHVPEDYMHIWLHTHKHMDTQRVPGQATFTFALATRHVVCLHVDRRLCTGNTQLNMLQTLYCQDPLISHTSHSSIHAYTLFTSDIPHPNILISRSTYIFIFSVVVISRDLLYFNKKMPCNKEVLFAFVLDTVDN